MNLDIESPVIALQAGEVLTLDDAQGVRIHARLGTVWITEEDDIEDHIVGPGEALVVAKRGRTVVQALAFSWIAIQQSLAAANDPTQIAA